MPEALLALPPVGGHGKVWHRVLAHLRERVSLVAIDADTGRPTRGIDPRAPRLLLCDGHTDLPPARSPIVIQVHEVGWFTEELRDTLDPAFHEYIASRTRAAVRAATAVITPSESSRRDVVALYDVDPEKVHAVAHGVDAVFCPEARGGRGLVRSRSGRDAPYVLYAAAIHPRKNLAALREAMAGLAAGGLPHLLVVAGGPATDRGDSSDLEAAASAELPGAPGRVVRIERPDDRQLAGLMAGADAFCLPSLYEGFGLTALEAMACGTAVVVSDRGSLPEVVGGAGVVVPPTAEELERALRRLLTDRAGTERLGRAAATRARAFTWERTADGWLSVIRRAAARSGPRR